MVSPSVDRLKLFKLIVCFEREQCHQLLYGIGSYALMNFFPNLPVLIDGLLNLQEQFPLNHGDMYCIE
jgi:hypothetical protein